MLYGTSKRLLIGKNGHISGWGLFAGESIGKGEYIGEYAGECISEDQADARDAILVKVHHPSYLFSLSQSGNQLDAERLGNKLRYANHSHTHHNMFAKKKVVNGLQRVAFYASENIPAGAEILFPYGEDYPAMPSLRPAVIDGAAALQERGRQ